MNTVTAGFASNSPDLSEWMEGLLSGELTGSFASAPELDVTDGTVSGTVRRLLSERPPDVAVLAGIPAVAPLAISLDHGDIRLDRDLTGLETERTLFQLALNRVRAHPIGNDAARTLALTAHVLLCADTVGAVSRAVQIVTQYLAERHAFEVPITSFQIIQHRLVNLATFESAGEALVLRAAAALADGEHTSERLALAAHAYIENRAVQAIDDCIQLAGGIGFTWEFPIHHALRRASTNAALLGSGRSSRHRLAEVEGRVA
jgi:hypothetical protein